MALISATIANNGVVMEPHIVKQTLTSGLDAISITKPKEFGRVISKTTAKHIQEIIVVDVKSGMGHRAAVSDVKAVGKTGAAEINASAPPYVWFVNSTLADDPKIIVAVVVENSGNAGWSGDGGSVAVPIAKKVLQAYLGSP